MYCDFFVSQVKTTNPKKYCVRPNTGVVMPQSTCDVIGTNANTTIVCINIYPFICLIVIYYFESMAWWYLIFYSYHASAKGCSGWYAMQGQVSSSKRKSRWWNHRKGYHSRNGSITIHHDIANCFNFTWFSIFSTLRNASVTL